MTRGSDGRGGGARGRGAPITPSAKRQELNRIESKPG